MYDKQESNNFQDKEKKIKNFLWLKRLGLAGFLFFFIKGLLWIIIPILIAYGLWSK